jgi:cyclophilin family peptidyl-prolyl cis-trans isomerase
LTAGLAGLASLAGCGGGDAGRQPAVVTLGTATPARYGETMLVTLAGSRLDQPLTLASDGCRDFVRGTSAPTASTATTAYYTCTVSGRTGERNVAVVSEGVTIAEVRFTVPVPEVTMVVTNGSGAAGGTLVITLAPDLAPRTVDNFLAYVKAGFYGGVAFHRHARFANLGSFALQAGAYAAPVASATAFPEAKPTRPPIALERGLSHRRYVVGMARTNAPDSATSQFFINTADNLALDGNGTAADPGYAAFGTVTAGMAVVDAMAAATCNLSPINFNAPPPAAPSADCVPEPNLVIDAALQTR